MNVKSLLAILFFFTIYNHAWAEDCTVPPVTLEDNTWKLISLPCDPQRASSVVQVFDKVLSGDDYDVKWVVYTWDGSKYVKMLANPGAPDEEYLRQGYGYWIIQVTGVAVDLRMPPTAIATDPAKCARSATTKTRCLDISPTTKDGGVGWTMLGNPYNEGFSVDRLLVQADAEGLVPPGSPGDIGSTLGAAHGKRVFNQEIFRYNGTNYDKLSGSQSLSAWDGFWGATLEKAHGKNTRLRFTKEP